MSSFSYIDTFSSFLYFYFLFYSLLFFFFFFFFSSRRRHTRLVSDWSSDVCSSDLVLRKEAISNAIYLSRARARAGACSGRRRLRAAHPHSTGSHSARARRTRSEERRVGKECRSRWSADHLKKKKKRTERENDSVRQ